MTGSEVASRGRADRDRGGISGERTHHVGHDVRVRGWIDLGSLRVEWPHSQAPPSLWECSPRATARFQRRNRSNRPSVRFFTVHRAPTVRGRHVRGIPVHPDPQAARRGGYRLPVRGGHRRQPRRRVHARHRAPPLVAPGCTGRSEGMQTRLADTRGTGRRGRRDVVRGEPRRAVRGAHKRRGGDPTV